MGEEKTENGCFLAEVVRGQIVVEIVMLSRLERVYLQSFLCGCAEKGQACVKYNSTDGDDGLIIVFPDNKCRLCCFEFLNNIVYEIMIRSKFRHVFFLHSLHLRFSKDWYWCSSHISTPYIVTAVHSRRWWRHSVWTGLWRCAPALLLGQNFTYFKSLDCGTKCRLGRDGGPDENSLHNHSHPSVKVWQTTRLYSSWNVFLKFCENKIIQEFIWNFAKWHQSSNTPI